MANANISLLSTSNTFLDEMITVNNLTNTVNELRNGNFYKDGGNFTVANGTIISLITSGTGLQVTANSILGGLTTLNTSLHTGIATFSSNVTMLANLSVAFNIANVGNLFVTQNAALGNLAITQNATTGNLVVAQNTTTGNLTVTLLLSVPGNLTVGNLSTTNANLPNINFDNAGNYSQNNGNLIINNLTVKGNTTTTGNTTVSTDTFQLRNGVASDGDGHFEVWRGSTIAANMQIKFNHSANVPQWAANDSQTFVTILTTANVVDGFTSNSTASTVSANAAQTVFNIATAAYAQANSAANTVRTSQNGGSTLFANGINFNNTANVTVTVASDGTGNANISIFSSAGQPPGGANQQIQFNDNTLFGGSANIIYNKANGQMVVNNETLVSNLTFATGANAVQPTLAATREVVSNLANINNPNTATINLAISNNWDLTTANTTQGNINLTFASWANSGNLQTCTIIVRQSGAAANTSQSSANGVTFTNANVIWSNGEVPVLAAFVGKLDILTFVTTDGGVHVYGAHSMANVG